MPQLTICSPSLQVEDTVNNNLFLHEAHIHALANKKDVAIVVVQPKSKAVDLKLYEPGWSTQRAFTRQEMHAALNSTPHPLLLYLDKNSKHFQAILPKAPPEKRSSRGHLASAGSSSSDAIDAM